MSSTATMRAELPPQTDEKKSAFPTASKEMQKQFEVLRTLTGPKAI